MWHNSILYPVNDDLEVRLRPASVGLSSIGCAMRSTCNEVEAVPVSHSFVTRVEAEVRVHDVAQRFVVADRRGSRDTVVTRSVLVQDFAAGRLGNGQIGPDVLQTVLVPLPALDRPLLERVIGNTIQGVKVR